MAKNRNINVVIKGDYDNSDVQRAIKELQKLQKETGATEGSMGGFGKTMAGVGAGLLAAFSVSKVIDFGKAAISAASDLNEMQSKVDQVFGAGSGHLMDTWAQGAAASMGLSQTAALDAASSFGIFADAAGMTSGKAASFSQQMTQLAGDLASFNNTSVPDAVQAIGAALRGEMEPIRRYGVMLDDASLKAAAMAQGIYNGNGPLTQQQKIMAASTAIMQQTTKAQGDYARTADGLANTMRTIQAATENATASIGGGFLIAINSINKSMGGGEGMAGLIENTGQVMGDFVAGLGVLIAKVVELAPATDEAAKKVEPLQRNWDGFLSALANSEDPLSAVGNVIYWLGTTERTTAEAAAANFNAHLILEQGYLDNANAAKRAASETGQAAAAQRDAKATTDALTAAFSRQNLLLDALSGRISLEAYYDGLTKALEKSGRSLDITTEKGRTNATTLADGIKTVTDSVEAWGKKTNATSEEIASKTDKEMARLRASLIKHGFKPSDIDAFMNVNAGWVPAWKRVGDQAQAAGVGIGKDLGAGVKQGVEASAAALGLATADLMRYAEKAARDEAQTHSPSKKFQAIGQDLVDGLTLGLGERTPGVVLAVQRAMQAAINAAKDAGRKSDFTDSMGTVMDKITSVLSDKLGDLQGKLDDATTKVKDWASSMSSTLMGAFDISAVFEDSVDAQGNLVGSKLTQGFDAAIKKFQWFNNVIAAIRNQPGGQALSEFLVAQGMDKGGAWGQALIDQGLVPSIAAQMNSVKEIADTTAQAMVPAYLTAGVDQALAQYNGMKAALGKDGQVRKAIMGLMDNLAAAMARDVPIDVWITRHIQVIETKVAAATAVPKVQGATGGIVNVPTVALIGEAGPEAVIPLDRSPGNGPVGALGGGNSYSITVQAGVGDPRQIGQQVVEYIKRFEAANGNVFAAA